MTFVEWGYCSEEDKHIIQDIVQPVIFKVIPEAKQGDMWVLGVL